MAAFFFANRSSHLVTQDSSIPGESHFAAKASVREVIFSELFS
jgi:hypothetical protein